jgi:hypothetical protein
MANRRVKEILGWIPGKELLITNLSATFLGYKYKVTNRENIMKSKFNTLTLLSFLSSLALATTASATEQVERPKQGRIKFVIDVAEDSALAVAFMADQRGALTRWNAQLKAELKANALHKGSLEGSFAALRDLAREAKESEKPELELQWYFTELLMSFGESFEFRSMVAASRILGPKTAEKSLIAAATWLQENYYSRFKANPNNLPFRKFNDAFQAYFPQGNVSGFYGVSNSIKGSIGRVSYLNFFRYMGFESSSPLEAETQLTAAIKHHNTAAVQLMALLTYVKDPTNGDAWDELLYETKGKTRPIMRHVNSVMLEDNGVLGTYELESEPQNTLQAIQALKDTLDIT